MSKDITEYIDDYCKEHYGHTNWGYKSTYSQYELDYTDKDYDIDVLDGAIVFWHEPSEEEE
jgi:hypothetical protein